MNIDTRLQRDKTGNFLSCLVGGLADINFGKLFRLITGACITGDFNDVTIFKFSVDVHPSKPPFSLDPDNL